MKTQFEAAHNFGSFGLFLRWENRNQVIKTQRRERIDITNWCRWDSDAPLWLFSKYVTHCLRTSNNNKSVQLFLYFFYCCFWLPAARWFTGFCITMEPSTEVKKFKNLIFLCNELQMRDNKKETQHSDVKWKLLCSAQRVYTKPATFKIVIFFFLFWH